MKFAYPVVLDIVFNSANDVSKTVLSVKLQSVPALSLHEVNDVLPFKTKFLSAYKYNVLAPLSYNEALIAVVGIFEFIELTDKFVFVL